MSAQSKLPLLQQLLAEDPENTFLLYAIAQEYQKATDWAEAIDAYEVLKATDPKYVGLYYHQGKCYDASQQPSKALETYAAGIAVAKALPDFHALSELNTAKLNLEMEIDD